MKKAASREPHFHFSISNASCKPLRIWREWCPWGYHAHSTEITDEGSRLRVNTDLQDGFSIDQPADFGTYPDGEKGTAISRGRCGS